MRARVILGVGIPHKIYKATLAVGLCFYLYKPCKRVRLGTYQSGYVHITSPKHVHTVFTISGENKSLAHYRIVYNMNYMTLITTNNVTRAKISN